MSFDWGSRPTDYGRGGGIDMDLVYNDPRFATAVTDAIKQSPTMRSAFPHSSIDPRAIYPVQRVTTLPNARERYDGLEVEYCPNGLDDYPVWRLVWRQAANGGSGAWVFIGGRPLVVNQSSAAGHTTASLSTYTDMSNITSIAPGVAGVFDVQASGSMYLPSTTLAEARVVVTDSTTSVSIAFVSLIDQYESSTGGNAWPARITSASAPTFKLRVATNNKQVNFGSGDGLWGLSVIPSELRPEG